MKQTAQFTGSTQSFTEILDIHEDIVLLKGGNACIILQVQSVNFALLSKEEQDSKVYAYAALLNSLSFPVQIFVRSKKIDIMPYIASLADAAAKTTNQKLAQNIQQYKSFVEQLVTTTTILDKQFYMVISYSALEEGVGGASKIAHLGSKNTEDFFIKAKAALHTKAESLLTQIDRMALRAKIVEQDTLVNLFHDVFNAQGSEARQTNNHAVTAMKGTI